MIVPKRLVSICARKSDIGVSSTDERLPYPALLITTSSEPNASIAVFTAPAADDSLVTSARRASPGHGSAPIAHAVTQCRELSPTPYCPPKGPLRQLLDPARENYL